MIGFRIGGFLLAILSAVALIIAVRGLRRMRRHRGAQGIRQPTLLALKTRMMIWGWTCALITGIALAVHSYQ